ncbi:MAG: type II toxin-antitoxin system PemK/MazF family toxin [Patescibacteria group bacterium]
MEVTIEALLNLFVSWTKLKIKEHIKEREFYFYEKQVWWASLGQNIGREQNGKNSNFERPILVFKKFNEDTLWAISASSKIKIGKYYEIFHLGEKEFSLNLSQLRLISSKRLLRLSGEISKKEYDKIKERVRELI